MNKLSEIFHYTYGGPELVMLFFLLIVMPVVFFLIKKKLETIWKISIAALLMSVSVLIAYADVYQIAKEGEKLCREEAGLRIYKIVKAKGFLGAGDIVYWSKFGIDYLEMEFVGGNKFRYTINERGEVNKIPVDSFISRYKYDKESEIMEKPIVRERKLISDRQTGEVLGEIVSFAIYPGWLDSRLIGLLGISWSPLGCDGPYLPEAQKVTFHIQDLVGAVFNLNIARGK